MKRKFKASLTSVSLPIFIADTSSTVGGGLSGVTSASSGLVMEYRRAGQSTYTSVTPQAGKTLGSYLSGGIVADGSLSGAYEVDFPDAAFAAGASMVVCRVRGVTNMLAVLIEIELDAVDYQDATAFGLSRIDQTIGSRMASYTQPIGFLAATFPATVASPTNITSASGVVLAGVTHTAAVIPTVTDVTVKTGYTATVTDKTGFSLLPTTGLGNQTANITGNLSGSVNSVLGNVSGSVGSISGVTFPTHFQSLAIAANGYVTATVDAINNNAITASSIQNNAFTASKFAVDSITASALAADAATEIANAVGALQILTRLDSMIESDGAGQFRFDTIALQMAPAGGGGGGTDWTANERIAIRSILGVPTSGTTPTDPTSGILDEIRDKTGLITSGSVQTSIPVTAQGQINGPLYIGDDYLTANARAFDWTISLPTGFVAATASCKFGMIYEDETGVSQFNLSGTVTDVGSGNVRLRFELPRATTGTLKAGFHTWSVEIVSASGVEVTPVAYHDRKLVEWREKQT